MQYIIRILFGLLLVCTVLGTHAQQPVWLSYTSADGLPSNEVYQVHQDKHGFIWLCTDGGVSVYDGKTFRNFSSENGAPDNTVLGLFEADNDIMWFRTLAGNIFYINLNTFELFNIEAAIPDYLMTSLYVDEDENIYTALTSSDKLYKIKPPHRQQDISHYTDSTCKLNVYLFAPSNVVYFKNFDVNNNTCVVHYGDVALNLQLPNALVIRKVISVGDGLIFCEEFNNYLYRGNKFIPFQTDNLITNASQDNDGNLIVCLGKNEGVCIYDGMNVEAAPKRYFKGTSLSSVIQDNENNYWLSSMTDGLLMVPSFSLLVYSHQDNSHGTKTTGVYCTDDNHVMGKYYDNVFFNPMGGAVAASDKVSMSCRGGVRVHSSKGIEIQDNPFAEEYPRSEVFQLRGYDGYFAMQPRAVTFCNAQMQIVERFVPETRINGYALQGDSILWLACLDGLWSFANGSLHIHKAEHPLFNMRLDDADVAPDGTLWLCSRSDGVVMKRDDVVKNFTIKDGLVSNICRTIMADGQRLWVGTNRGISRWNTANDHVNGLENISLQNGLPSAEISMIKKSGNTIWVASDAGIFSFHEDHDFGNSTAPIIHLNHVLVNGNYYAEIENASLNYNENFIEISMSCLSYRYPMANSFRYRLQGLDTAWVTTGNGNITFTTLPPGSYTFTAFAMNNSGLSSTVPAVVTFTIGKPWWQRWWFVALAALAVAVVVYLLVQRRIKAIHHAAEEKTALARKMAELEMRALRTQMNPHFIFNCINSIQHFILSNEKMIAQKHLSRFAKLIRNVLENSKQDWIPLQTELETLELYIEMEALRFENKFTYTIHTDSTVDKVSTLVPPMLIQPFAENAILHGLLPLKTPEGTLHISIAKNNGHLKCVVTDNGIGRTQAALLNNKKKEGRKSYGINITSERLALLSNKDTRVDIADIHHADGSPAGTCVTFFIPLLKA
ncbi:MAG: sensor histidine kinase [Flavobacteriales bacterium]